MNKMYISYPVPLALDKPFKAAASLKFLDKRFYKAAKKKAPIWFLSSSDVMQARTWKPFFFGGGDNNKRQNNGMIHVAPPCFQWLNVTVLFCQGWGLWIEIGNVNRCPFLYFDALVFFFSFFFKVPFEIVNHCCESMSKTLDSLGCSESHRAP